MHRPSCALLLAVSCSGILVAACSEIESEFSANARPYDLPYLTSQIFAPSCGQTQCHSKFHGAAGLVFDNPDDVRASLLLPSPDALLQFTSKQYDPRRIDGRVPNLIRWITEIDPLGRGVGRMPFDMPLADMDIQLLEAWIQEPREHIDPETGEPVIVGASAKGAQCNPKLFGGFACNFNQKVRCTDDWNFGAVEETCGNCTYDFNRLVLVCTP